MNTLVQKNSHNHHRSNGDGVAPELFRLHQTWQTLIQQWSSSRTCSWFNLSDKSRGRFCDSFGMDSHSSSPANHTHPDSEQLAETAETSSFGVVMRRTQ
jgi:hypothetical protein